jgi:hypothetical protein
VSSKIVANLEYMSRTEKMAANGNVKGALEGSRRNLVLNIIRQAVFTNKC